MIELGKRTEVEVSGYSFYIEHFDPFTAISVLGDLQKIVTPILGKFTENLATEGDTDVMDSDFQNLMSAKGALSSVFNALHEHVDGETLVKTLKLLLRKELIAVSIEGAKPERLTDEVIIRIFNGDIGGILELAYQVVKVNYEGFFTTAANRFGTLGALAISK